MQSPQDASQAAPPGFLKETGLVTKIENGIAWVNTENKLSCSSCQVESTCGNGILEKYLAGKVFISKLDNLLNAKVGDRVDIIIPISSVTKAAFVAYTIPLLGLFVGAIAANQLFDNEIVVIFMSLLGFVCGLLITHSYNSKVAFDKDYVPKMIAKHSSGFSPSEFESIRVKNLS
ncbi:SoxR reducing system RseC family protein [Aliikangiella marina]|uniref:SoxR reducing system RseC family protein n=1 Tax=Aliikangiella marina TaxID=1712262 RepID=UPI00163D86B3|nr:SoxR reducing system RseC family protein [Aliikangiella marina]